MRRPGPSFTASQRPVHADQDHQIVTSLGESRGARVSVRLAAPSFRKWPRVKFHRLIADPKI
jgi:hypothetical protein